MIVFLFDFTHLPYHYLITIPPCIWGINQIKHKYEGSHNCECGHCLVVERIFNNLNYNQIKKDEERSRLLEDDPEITYNEEASPKSAKFINSSSLKIAKYRK